MSSKTKPSKILLVSASIGDGHSQAAYAIKAAIENDGLATAEVVDFMAGDNSYINTFVKESYLKMIDIFPDIYDLLYRWSQMRRPGSKVQNLLAMAMKRTMLNLVKTHHPDAIVCTHPFACGAAAYLKHTHRINLPLAGVITDFAIHRLWCHSQTDLYFVAAEELKQELAQQGIKDTRIHATGIPVGLNFSQLPNELRKASVKSTLGFTNNNHPVVLVMGGGLGFGDLEDAVLSLDELSLPLNVVVVAGRNAALRRSLAAKAKQLRHQVKVLGFTRHIPELMAIADVLITKPGALTSSEALAMRLPMLLCQSIPGQEEENAAYLVHKGAALCVKSKYQLAPAVHDLFTQPERLIAMREVAGRISRPDAARIIATTIYRELLNAETAVFN